MKAKKDLSPEDFKTRSAVYKFISQYQKAAEKGGNFPDPIDSASIWRLMLNIAISNSYLEFGDSVNTIALYRSFVEEFRTFVPEFISDNINKLKDDKNPQTLSHSLNPYIWLMPFLDLDSVLSVLMLSRRVISKHLKTNSYKQAFAFLKMFNDVVTAEFNPDVFDGMVDFFKQVVDTEQGPHYVLILSHFAIDFINIDDNLENFFKDIITNFLGSDEQLKKISGFYFLNKYFPYLEVTPEAGPSTDFMLDAIFPQLITSNQGLSIAANKAAKSLIKSIIFQDQNIMNKILGLFDNYPVSQIDLFFDIIHVIIYPVSDTEEINYNPQMKNLIPIRDFIADKLQNSNQPQIQAHCINVLSDFMSIKKSFAQKYYALAYETAQNLLKKKFVVVYNLISPFLAGMCKLYPEQCAEDMKKSILIFSEVLIKDKPLNKKQRLDLAIDISSMCKALKMGPPPNIWQLVQLALVSKSQNEFMRATTIILELIRSLDRKKVNGFFEKICDHALKATTDKSLDFYTYSMIKILKHYNIDPKIVSNFLNCILTLSHPLKRNQFPIFIPQFTDFITLFVKRAPTGAPLILECFRKYIQDINPNSLMFGIPGVLLPIKEMINYKMLKIEDFEIIWEKIKYLFKKGNMIVHGKGICISIETLQLAFDKMPELVDPIDEKISSAAHFLNGINLEGEFVEQMQKQIEIVPTLCDFVFDVYANKKNAKLDENLFNRLIDLMPFPWEVKCNQSILKNLIKIMFDERFELYKIKVCRIIVSYLLLDKKELNRFKFNDAFIKEMKESVKKVAHENDKNISKIGKYFPNEKRDMPLLQKIVE